MKKLICLIFALVFSVSMIGACNNEEPPETEQPTNYSIYPQKENVVVDKQLYTDGEVQFSEELWKTPEIRRAVNMDFPLYRANGYYIKSAAYKGEDTYVFGYLCIPEGEIDKPLPAIVLVHGGGGTAFADLAHYWANRGYVAFSIDVEGRVPGEGGSVTTKSNREESPMPHGPNNTIWADSEKPYDEQWMYHAIAAVVSSVTFLSNLPEVDPSKIGCLGISWGSVVISATAVYEDRLAFCVPIYGSIGLSGTPSREGINIDKYPRAVELWDRNDLLVNSTTPFLFVNSQVDHAFSQEVHSNCGKYLIYKQYLFIPDLTHGHYQCMNIKEIDMFVDNICLNKDSALMQIETAPTNSLFTLKMKGGQPESAVLYYTKSPKLNGNLAASTVDPAERLVWEVESLVPAEDGTFSFDVPSDSTYYFITVTGDNGARVSTDLIKM